MANNLKQWNSLLGAILKIPGAKVNRNKFLEDELRQYCNVDTLSDILDGNNAPYKAIGKDRLDKIANQRINNNIKKAAFSSIITGLPGGTAIFATLPADLIQYYYFLFKTAQELAYLYGYPNFYDADNEFTERSLNILTIFIGVMSNDTTTTAGLKAISKQFIDQLDRGVFYGIAREVAKKLGLRVSQRSFSTTFGKVIPVVGGLASGAITWISFKPAATRLKKRLQEGLS